MHVVKRRELMPLHAADYCKRALAKAAASPPDEGVPLDAPPGHAEGGAPKKSRGASAPNFEGGPLEATPKHGPGSASSSSGALPVQVGGTGEARRVTVEALARQNIERTVKSGMPKANNPHPPP